MAQHKPSEEAGVLCEPFSMGTTRLGFLGNRPSRIPGAFIMVCDRGEARVGIDVLQYTVSPRSGLFLLPGSIISLNSVGSGFNARYFYLSAGLFSEATYKLDADFFRFLKEHPVIGLDGDGLEFLERWASLVSSIAPQLDDGMNLQILRNLLQCLFWKSYDRMKRFFGHNRAKTRRQDELFHDFMRLVKANCRTHRDVEFYARKLFISPRYLSFVCSRNANNLSAKKIIDLQTVLEIKILLETTNEPVQKIAEKLLFPDQSYFGRFFKRYTGQSPLAYRFHKEGGRKRL